MFPFITGVTISEYIRHRRLTLAAFELQATDIKIIDAAVKYGYDSPDAFTRAFKNIHGIMPVSARDAGVSLKAYPRMTFQIYIKGDTEMDYRIVQREAFEMFGVCAEIDGQKPFEDVPKFHGKIAEEKSNAAINALLGRHSDANLHAALYDFTEANFKYMICYFLPKGLEIPDKFTKLSIPALTWAIFTMPKGINMQEFRRRIWSEWFPTSGYEQVKAPEFEAYYPMGIEMWVPVRTSGGM
jgi:AraC family transcriptional regulator